MDGCAGQPAHDAGESDLHLVTDLSRRAGAVIRMLTSADAPPIATICRVPLVMEVHPSVPAKTVAAFIAYAKGNPGKINLASAEIGSLPHMAGVDLFHVPYRGAQVFPALLAGDVQVYFGPLLSSIEFIRAGKLRALAVTTATRSDALARFRLSPKPSWRHREEGCCQHSFQRLCAPCIKGRTPVPDQER